MSKVLSQNVIRLLIIASVFVATADAYQGSVCCRRAARRPEIRQMFGTAVPWQVCSLNKTDQYTEGTTFPSVNVTMGWCKENCPGIQHSTLEEWLQPIATWIVPYIALLLLCPIGRLRKTRRQSAPKEPKNGRGDIYMFPLLGTWLRERFLEYVGILGDPASALFGAFSQIYSDWILVHRREHCGSNGSRARVLEMIVLAGGTDYLDPVNKLDDLEQWKGPSGDSKRESMVERLLADDRETRPDFAEAAEAAEAVKILVGARVGFINAVFLPVILTLAVVATVFYEGYQKLGDNDTAHGLAFGVWYSWLLILAVASNCFASSANPGLAQRVLKEWATLSDRQVTLRERYINSKLWALWEKGEPTPKVGKLPRLGRGIWLEYLFGQVIAWVCVAFTCACAAAISYTTPTVGLGCRSFTFMFYGILAAVAALLRICCQWVELKSACELEVSTMQRMMKYSYWIFTYFNAIVVLFIGTVLHLAGVYRSCRCKRLSATDSDLVEVNQNTVLAVMNAKRIWLPVGYVAFTVIWIICAFVIAGRRYITVHIEKWEKNAGNLRGTRKAGGGNKEDDIMEMRVVPSKPEIVCAVGEWRRGQYTGVAGENKWGQVRDDADSF